MKSVSLALLFLLASTAAAAQEAVPTAEAPNATPDMCEIHVWTAAKLNTLTEGAIWNNVVDSAILRTSDKTTERAVPAGRLEPEGQIALLRGVELDKILHHPGATIVMHDGPSARRGTGSVTGRQTSSTSRCYVEFTVAKNFFNRSGLAERTLRTLFVFDDFGDQPVPQRTFMGWGSTELQIFPAKKPELMQAADDELANAFRANTVQFGKYAFAPPKKR